MLPSRPRAKRAGSSGRSNRAYGRDRSAGRRADFGGWKRVEAVMKLLRRGICRTREVFLVTWLPVPGRQFWSTKPCLLREILYDDNCPSLCTDAILPGLKCSNIQHLDQRDVVTLKENLSKMSPRLLGSLCRNLDLNCLVHHQIHELVKTLLCTLAARIFANVIVGMPYPNLSFYPDSELLEEPYGDW